MIRGPLTSLPLPEDDAAATDPAAQKHGEARALYREPRPRRVLSIEVSGVGLSDDPWYPRGAPA
jgi:hypothetical protein